MINAKPITELDAFNYGFDSVISGANTVNCNFQIFGSKALMEAWSRGAKTARELATAPADGER